MENYRNSIDAALDFVHEGKAHAIGEVGRPHWPVNEEIWDLSNTLLLETMHMAKKEGVALIHVEGELESTYKDMATLADKAGLERKKIGPTLCSLNIDHEVTHGVTPSVLIGKGALEEVLETASKVLSRFSLKPITWMMFDIGAVLGPKTVLKKTNNCLKGASTRNSYGKLTRTSQMICTAQVVDEGIESF